MRYALISDIHGNLPALDAVLRHIALDAPDAVHHVGDLVGYGPWPNEVVERLRSDGVVGVGGNYDSTVATRYKHCGCRSENAEQESLSHRSFEWTLAHVTPETVRHLAALPFRLDLRPRGGHAEGPRIILVHGTPALNTAYWTEDRPDSFCLRMAELAGARAGDVLCFGHTHMPWTREVEGIHFINTGSVGRPKDGDPRAGYVRLDYRGDRPVIDFVRLEYDVEAAASAIALAGLPVEFADFLRTGGEPAPAAAAS